MWLPELALSLLPECRNSAGVSIFSDLNNLIDISMHKRYADMLGYTSEELQICFTPYIKALADEMEISPETVSAILKNYYDGYRFSPKKIQVYNPFSVLRAFSNLEVKNYWFETGTPTFLVNLLHENSYHLPDIESIEVDEETFSVYELKKLSPEALLFQTGYLTIKSVDDHLYTLSYPNHEVKQSFLRHLYYSFTQEMDGASRSRYLRLSKYLKEKDYDAFFKTVNAIFASIAYTLKTEKNEAYFHTLFYLMVSASGMNVRSEVLTSRGRIDLVVEFEESIYLIEFKCNRSAKAGIKQIHEKGYAEKYRQSGKRLIFMGINFSSEKKNVEEWKIEYE